MKAMAERVEWETRPKPVWWSPAWDELAETREASGNRIPADSPYEFKKYITDDVFALDEVVMEQSIDPDTGEQVDSSVNPELIKVAAVVVWNARGSTMSRRCDRDSDRNDLLLTLFEDALKLVPDNRSLTYVTHSDWLFEQWSDMLGWQSVGYQGLDRKACPPQWKGIMNHVETRVDQVRMVKLSESDIEPKIRNAVALFTHEGVNWYREFLATPVGGDYRPAVNKHLRGRAPQGSTSPVR
jgi:hypothetical protein